MATPFRQGSQGDPIEPLGYNTPRPITAAASRIKLDDTNEADLFRKRRSSSIAAWQTEAWEYYDAIGELKHAFNLVAAVISRIRLYAAIINSPSEPPISVTDTDKIDPMVADAAVRALQRLDSAYGGQSGLLRDASLNLNVAGECYLVQIPARPGTGIGETWDIRSVDEVQVDKAGNYTIVPRRDLLSGNSGTSGTRPGVIALPKNAFVGRIWRAHPRFSEEPDSSLKGVLDLCAELLLLNRSFRSIERSRLNAGAMYIPDGLSSAAAPDPDLYSDDPTTEPTPEEQEDEFENQLMEAMTTPIEDESSASAVVPLIIRGPAELGEKIKQFKFERSYDGTMIKRADTVLTRILQGTDIPKDSITGLANVRYSNAAQIEKNLYKTSIEPMLLLICDAFTVVFLRPYLASQNIDPAVVNRLVVWYDPSAVTTSNDRGTDADKGYENMSLSAAAWRREHGFSENDAPTPSEVVIRLLQDKAVLAPELVQSLLQVIAPDLMNQVRAANQSTSVAPIPGAVQDVLNGGQPGAAPTTPDASGGDAAPTDGSAPATPDAASGDATDQTGAVPGSPVEPGQDAAPFSG